MMTLEEQKLAVCEKLPELICMKRSTSTKCAFFWMPGSYGGCWENNLNWTTEGLQVCHEAEKLLTRDEQLRYVSALYKIKTVENNPKWRIHPDCHATCEQRLEALCRVWFPERFQ